MSENLNTLLGQEEEIISEIDNIHNNDVLEEIVSNIENDTEIEKTDGETALKANKVVQLEKDYIIKIRTLKDVNSQLRIERDKLQFALYQIQKIIENVRPILETK